MAGQGRSKSQENKNEEGSVQGGRPEGISHERGQFGGNN